MNFRLRLLADSDIPELQRIYDASPEAFRTLFGAPALPDQAARDFVDALRSPGRFQFGAEFGVDLIGIADCKLDDEEEGLAHIGLILLAPAYDDPAILGLVVRVLERWLLDEYMVHRIEVGVLASAANEIAFWQSQGYEFTGAQYRREVAGRAPRFLVMAKGIG